MLPDRANERREGARGVPELQPQHPDCVQRAGIRRQVCEQRLEARSGAHAIAGSVSFDCSGEDPLVGLRLPIGLRGKTSFFSPIELSTGRAKGRAHMIMKACRAGFNRCNADEGWKSGAGAPK